jgi:hypothetical protein
MPRGVLTRLVLLALFAPVAVHNAAYAGKDNKQPVPAAPTFSKEVEGIAQASEKEAIDRALEKAAEDVADYLKEQKSRLEWKQDAGYVRDHLLGDVRDPSSPEWSRQQFGTHTILVKKGEFGVGGEPFTYQVRLQVVVKSDDVDRLRKAEQERREALRPEVVKQRQLWLGKILLGFVALLTGITGYIRLEDATKGYYTAWLRLGLVGVLCAVGAGLWLAS